MQLSPHKPLPQVFSDLDITGDGFVTAQEVRAVLSHLHTPFSRHAAGSTGKQLEQWIADRDQDGDGESVHEAGLWIGRDLIERLGEFEAGCTISLFVPIDVSKTPQRTAIKHPALNPLFRTVVDRRLSSLYQRGVSARGDTKGHPG